MENKNEIRPQIETVLGGSEIEIKFIDGTTKMIKVRQLPVRLYPRFFATMDKEAEMVELLTGMKPVQVDALTFESHEDIVAEGERVNGGFFGRWLERSKIRQQKLAPEMQAMVAEAVARQVKQSV
jgi:hypothetical protein